MKTAKKLGLTGRQYKRFKALRQKKAEEWSEELRNKVQNALSANRRKWESGLTTAGEVTDEAIADYVRSQKP